MIDLTVVSAGTIRDVAVAAALAYGAFFGVLWVVGRMRRGL